jgi:hypothetical protein
MNSTQAAYLLPPSAGISPIGKHNRLGIPADNSCNLHFHLFSPLGGAVIPPANSAALSTASQIAPRPHIGLADDVFWHILAHISSHNFAQTALKHFGMDAFY